MNILNKSKTAKSVLLGVLAGTALAAMATAASAGVVCNRSGECWHSTTRYNNYPVDVGGVWHTDHWYKAHAHDPALTWRADHNERGYYRSGVWVAF